MAVKVFFSAPESMQGVLATTEQREQDPTGPGRDGAHAASLVTGVGSRHRPPYAWGPPADGVAWGRSRASRSGGRPGEDD